MTKPFILLLMVIGCILGPLYVSKGDGAPGFSIYSESGTHNTGDFIPASDGNVTTTSQPETEDQLSRPFPERKETRVLIGGNTVLVPVKLGHGGKEISTWLVFDTGAFMTTLHKSVGDHLGVSKVTSAKSTIADGTVIDTQQATLDYMIVGPYRMNNVQAMIIDHKNDTNINKGLLGMNFIRNVDYKIDFARKVIKWSDN